MDRYLDFFLVALVVSLAVAIAYNIHKYGFTPTLEAIKKWLGIAETAVVADAKDVAAKAEASWERIEALFTRHTAATVTAVSAAVKAATPAPVPPAAPVVPVVPVPLSGVALQAAIDAAEAAIQAWLAPAINYALVTAEELTVSYKAALASSMTTYLDYTTGAVSYATGTTPSPSFIIQGKFLETFLHPGAGFPVPTEAERAYVGYNNDTAGGIGAHFLIAADGTVTAR